MCFTDDKENPDYRRILRHIELIDDEASEYGITIVKSTDKLMAKKYGYRKLPGLTYFRKGTHLDSHPPEMLKMTREREREHLC